MNPKNLKYITGILFILLLMQNACADITVTREIPETATADSNITINLKLDVVGGETSGIIVTEKIPEGVDVSSISNEGNFNQGTREIKWLIYSGKIESQTLSYAISASDAGTYALSGTFETLEEGSGDITGNNEVNVQAAGIGGIDMKLILGIIVVIVVLTLIFVLMKKK